MNVKNVGNCTQKSSLTPIYLVTQIKFIFWLVTSEKLLVIEKPSQEIFFDWKYSLRQYEDWEFKALSQCRLFIP